MEQNMYYCEVRRFEMKKRAFSRHTLSIAHRKSKLIRAMLEWNCITQAEIARRIGVTREHVRQLAQRMGFADGKSRHAICRIERRRKEMTEFFVKAEGHGFRVEPLRAKSAYINGMLCVQRQACWREIERRGFKYRYLSVRQPQSQFDICAWKLPDGRFLILPKKLMRFAQTTFSLEESDHPGTANSSHFYRKYIEGWNLLGEPGRAE